MSPIVSTKFTFMTEIWLTQILEGILEVIIFNAKGHYTNFLLLWKEFDQIIYCFHGLIHIPY